MQLRFNINWPPIKWQLLHSPFIVQYVFVCCGFYSCQRKETGKQHFFVLRTSKTVLFLMCLCPGGLFERMGNVFSFSYDRNLFLYLKSQMLFRLRKKENKWNLFFLNLKIKSIFPPKFPHPSFTKQHLSTFCMIHAISSRCRCNASFGTKILAYLCTIL